MRKQNAFNQWWFSLIVIPIIIFAFTFLESGASDQVMGGWFTILALAMVIQIIFIIKFKINEISIHLFYILLCLNVSMFTSYILNGVIGVQRILEDQMWDWIAGLISAAITGLFTYGFKLIIWWLLALKWKNMKTIEKKSSKKLWKNTTSKKTSKKAPKLETPKAKLND